MKQKQIKKVGQYRILLNELLGSGSFAKTYRAYKENNKQHISACKCINKQQMQSICDIDYVIKRVREEFKVLKSLKHENIIMFEDSEETKNNLYLFIEYCDGGTLEKYIKQNRMEKHNSQKDWKIIKQIIEGCSYLQQCGIVHRDIKPDNILFKSNKQGRSLIKIADFGLAKVLDQEDSYRSTMVGTFNYMAPEILKESKTKQTKKCDVWSVGITIYELLTGYLPYELTDKIKSPHAILLNIQQNTNFQFNEIKDSFLRGLVSKMLVLDTNDRITFKQAKLLLNQYKKQ